MRYSGKIGIGTQVDDGTGIWCTEIREMHVNGDIYSISKRYTLADKVNTDIELNMELSFIFRNPLRDIMNNKIEYVTHLGSKWRVTNIKVQLPRIVLTIGGIWNG